MRWWDGEKWAGDPIVPTHPKPQSRFDRLGAAVSHLGSIFGSMILPFVVWSTAPVGSLRRAHARQAFAYQALYLPFWVFFFFGAALFTNEFVPVFLCMATGVALAVPQMIRAVQRKPPWPWPPFFRLRA